MPCMTEEEYVEYLKCERQLFAWCLIQYGKLSTADAEARALDFYPYEPDQTGRGFKFHREAWDWVMLELYGPSFWETHPELAKPTAAYREERDKS